MTIRVRLTLWYGLTFMVLISLAGLVVWWQFEARLRGSLEETLRLHAEDYVTSLADGESAVTVVDPHVPNVFAALIDPQQGVVVAGPGTPADLPLLKEGPSTLPLDPGGPRYAFYAIRLPDGRQLVTGTSLAEVERGSARLGELLIAIGLVCAFVALAGGWWLAGRALAPVRRMTAEADAIGPSDLDHRLAVVHAHDEIGRLATTLNRLLARVEDAVGRERTFIAGAAHDLRTPIAALRMELDMLLRTDSLEPATRESLEDARRDVIDLGALADALLGLADAQAPGPHDAVEDVVLPALVARAEQDVEVLARERTVRIDQRVEEAQVRVSPVRFHQALANLLSNAVRHGPSGGVVDLDARLETAHDTSGRPGRGAVVRVEVADRGPGIDQGAAEHLFVPFGVPRGDATTAHGLGLATAAAAVRSQGGEIGYRDRSGGGSVFWFWLPLAAAEDGTSGAHGR